MNENKFNEKGKLYAQYRPCYPEDFIKYLYTEAGMTEESILADIGAGTGILTKHLLEQGNTVYAVEPNTDMLENAKCYLNGFTNVIYVNSAAEHTTLPRHSIDFITVAQAFHWFDSRTFKQECQRILKTDGKVVLVWNSRDETNAFSKENRAILEKYCPDFGGFSGGTNAKGAEQFSNFFANGCEERRYQNPVKFDEQRFIGYELSTSYAPRFNDKNYDDFIHNLKDIFAKYSEHDILEIPFITKSYIGTV